MSPSIPLNLSHAANLASRLEYKLRDRSLVTPPRLTLHLAPFFGDDSAPALGGSDPAVEEALRLARGLVEEIETKGAGEDRIGQLVRNLFECLGRAEEGALLSIRAGENPDSPLRPR